VGAAGGGEREGAGGCGSGGDDVNCGGGWGSEAAGDTC
jgi:hypothetical protein